MKTANQIPPSVATRRNLTARTAIASLALAAATLPVVAGNNSATHKGDVDAIRPFHISVPKAKLTDLRRRINAAKWPERELVADTSQGVQLVTMQKLARYWANDYDW